MEETIHPRVEQLVRLGLLTVLLTVLVVDDNLVSSPDCRNRSLWRRQINDKSSGTSSNVSWDGRTAGQHNVALVNTTVPSHGVSAGI